MNHVRTVIAAIIIISAITAGSVAIGAAQEGAPGPPANFYGEAVDDDGTLAPNGTTLVAVVDGTVSGEITVDEAGEYGGDDAFDEKLSLDSAAGDEVSFHVANASGPAALESPVDLESGTHEQSLTFPSGAFEDGDDSDSGSGSDPGSGPGSDPGDEPEPEPTEYTLELLAEQTVNHAHACTHGDYDDRTSLDAGDEPDETVVSDDHVIWAVTYEGSEGYVTFDTTAHQYDGPFVFYMADGSVDPVDATVTDSGSVDECDTLEEYIEVETPDDGTIDLELTGGDRESSPDLGAPGVGGGDDTDGPEANISVDPANPVIGETVTLNASNSSAPDSEIVAYEWSVGDKNVSGEHANITFDDPGEKTVELTVETDDDETGTTNETITVLDDDAAFFEVTSLEAPSNASPGDSLAVTATIENSGTEHGTATITYEFDGTVVEERSVDLKPDSETTLEFDAVAPDANGDYTHHVGTPNESAIVTTTVLAEPDTDEHHDDDDGQPESNESQDDRETDSSHDTESDDSESLPVSGFGSVAALAAIFGVLLVVRRD
ncbi:PKD domain-containing protein [Natronolimnobius sp. AArcel1]|uniref:PKD domain-containing protein n=1 Tax=Natronolimnobius sp. AArcel1 TaxID=1679093 RepID=UPI0013EBACCE|nr:PKD domain-containing protein [Natronolimnobius sp. AArcel1]NGM69621.1 PKD domain-containing protein [Natronolimnobius sp. AArcel1]